MRQRMHHLVVVPAVSPNDGGALAGANGVSDANAANGPGVNGGAVFGGINFPGRFAPCTRIAPVHCDLGAPAVTEWAVRQLLVVQHQGPLGDSIASGLSFSLLVS